MRLLPSLLGLGLLLGSVLLFAPPATSGSWTCSGTPYFNDPATELIVNGGFENDLANWYSLAIPPTISTTIHHSGAKSARVYSFGGAENAAQDLAPPPAVYIFSYQFYVGTWGPGGHFAAELLANWVPSLGTADAVTQVWWRPPNTMLWRVWTRNGGTDISRTYSRTLTTGTWHVLETVIDGNRGTQCLFIDGSAVDTFSVNPAATFSPSVIAFGDISSAEDAGEAYYDDISIQSTGPPLPDYVPVNPQPSAAIAIGESLPVSLSIGVMNRVNVSANASSTIAFFNESTPGSPFMTFSVPPLAGNGTAGPFTATWVSPGTPGPYRIVAEVDHGGTVREADEGNNRYTWTATVYPPPITSLSVGTPNYNGTYVTSATPLTLSVTDRSGSGIRRTEYRPGPGPWIPYTAPFTLTGEGEHLVEWFSEDNVGNVERVQGLSLRVDNTPPRSTVVVGTPNYNGAFVTSATRITLTTADGGPLPVGIATFQYSFDRLTWIPYVRPLGFTGSDGPRALYFRGADLLGNAEAVQTLLLVLDNTPPTTELSFPSGTLSVVSPFSLSSRDAGSGVALVEYRVDAGAWAPYAGPFSLPAGDHVIQYRSTDHLGNVEPVRTSTVRVENWKPIVALVLAAVLIALGVLLALLAPASADPWARWRTFLAVTVPFAIAEAVTGIVSLLNGTFAIPPLVDLGTFVDGAIFGIGVIVATLIQTRVRRRANPASDPGPPRGVTP